MNPLPRARDETLLGAFGNRQRALFGSKLADYWFPVTQGGDIALLYGVLKRLIDSAQVDHAFVEQHTQGFAELAERARQLDWATLEAGSGLPRPVSRNWPT